MKRLVIDLDGTITSDESATSYAEKLPVPEIIERIRDYKEAGFSIIVYTSRNMRTYDNSIGKINAHTLPMIVDWLRRHDVPYDEIHVGKPWCGTEGFYVDDRAIRPSEFISMTADEISTLLGRAPDQAPSPQDVSDAPLP